MGLLSVLAPLIAAQTCPSGTFGAGGSAPCTNCPPGKYSAAGATACTGTLVPYAITTAANWASSVHAGDVDGDGRVDVLSASKSDNKVAWYRNGGGSPVTWTPYIITSTANGARGVHAADVDGDGRVDVLSASELDDKIVWYQNLGGVPVGWTPYTITTTADGPYSVHVGDVDGDGRLDVLSASSLDNKIAWYRNGGGSPPSWAAYVISTTADGATCVHAADVDGDGRLDALSASFSDNTIAWYKNGGGSPVVWTPYNITTVAFGAACVYAADVDGDGLLDVLSASLNDDKIAWYKNGGGVPVTWTPYTITLAADGARGVYAADVDGDGRLDALSTSNADNKVTWYRNGGGVPVTWSPYNITTTANGAHAVCAADVNGDGLLDVLSTSTNDDKVAWYQNTMCPRGRFGPGGFSPCSPCPPGRFGSTSMLQACDACPAGRFETMGGTIGATNTSCSASEGRPATGTIAPFRGAVALATGDVDGDGDADVVYGLGSYVGWYANNAQGFDSWAVRAISSLAVAAQVYWVHLADMNGDGWLDAVVGA
jgi:hypothetical protein